jgi:hypothetical protein
MSSAAEREVGALFLNCKEGVSIRITLEEMGHPQPPTPVQVNNSTACGIANESIRQLRSRAMDIRFYWIQDRIRQNHNFKSTRPLEPTTLATTTPKTIRPNIIK